MRFRCEVNDDGRKCLLGVLSNMERMDPSVGIYATKAPRRPTQAMVWLTKDRMSLSVMAEESHGALMTFADLQVKNVFQAYYVESASGDNVYLSVSLKQLVRALSSSSNSAGTTLMKLAKRQGAACLLVCFEASSVSSVEHVIPIKLRRPTEVEAYLPPDHPRPRIGFELPAARTLQTLVDRFKQIHEKTKSPSKRVDVKFEPAGALGLRIVSDSALVRAFFTNLKLSKTDLRPGDAIVVPVDARNLAQALLSYKLDFDKILCSPVEGVALILNVTLANNFGDVHYYIPLLDDHDLDDRHSSARDDDDVTNDLVKRKMDYDDDDDDDDDDVPSRKKRPAPSGSDTQLSPSATENEDDDDNNAPRRKPVPSGSDTQLSPSHQETSPGF